jgi:hypothetical protein
MEYKHSFHLRMPLIVLGILAALLLSTCTQVVIQPTPQPGNGAPSIVPTMAPPDRATADPTTAPTSVPTTAPTSVPGQPALLGAEWTILAQGDLYGTGVETAIGYSRSGMEPTRADLPPAYVGYATTLEQLVVVQRNSAGQPFVRVLVSPGGIFVDGQSSPAPVPGGPDARTQGFALAHDHQSAPLRLVPLDTQGRPVATGFEVRPAPARGGFELVALPTPGGQPSWPGPEWQLAHQGDFNGDGLNEQIYVLPSTVVPDEATFYRPAYRAYYWVVREALIIQAQGGGQRVLATLSPDEVRSERTVLATLAGASGRPAAFFLAAPLDSTTPLAAIPLDSAGMGYAQGFGLRWDPAAGTYRLVSGPDATPPQLTPIPSADPVAGPQDPDPATIAVVGLLDAWMRGEDVRPYLALNLRAEAEAGRPLDQILGLHPITLEHYAVGAPISRPEQTGFSVIPALLSYQGFSEERRFTVIVEGHEWRISATAPGGS